MVLNKMSFAPANGPSRPRETAFASVNEASRCAGSHLPDKTGPRASREGICPTKRGLAHRGKPFARQNGASRCAGRHLLDKMGPRASRKAICPTKRGLALRGEAFARQNGASRPREMPSPGSFLIFRDHDHRIVLLIEPRCDLLQWATELAVIVGLDEIGGFEPH